MNTGKKQQWAADVSSGTGGNVLSYSSLAESGRLSSHSVRRLLRLYFIMGSPNCAAAPESVLEAALRGGATLFQFREKGAGALTGAAKLELARKLQAICRRHGVPFIVNDDLDLALQTGADGMHIGQDDLPAAEVRRLLGPDKLVGVSAHNPDEACRAIRDGADYLGIGPVYPTSSKDDARAVQGTSFISSLRAEGCDIPVVGIGGITLEKVAPVIRAGADGVSVISAIAGAPAPEQAAETLLSAVHRTLAETYSG